MTPNTPEIVNKVMDDMPEDLNTNEVKELAKEKDTLLDEAKNRTAQKLEDLKQDIGTEVQEDEANLDAGEKQVFQDIDTKLDEMIVAKNTPTPVDDVLAEKPKDQQTFMDKMNGFLDNNAFIGTLIKQYINFRTMISGIFGGANEAQTKSMEQLYGRFFGARETTNWLNTHFEEKGIKMTVTKGKADATAYSALKTMHQKMIEQEALSQLPSLNDPNTPQETKEAAMASAAQTISWEVALEKVADGYVQKYQSQAADEQYQTTLNGITLGKVPVEKQP